MKSSETSDMLVHVVGARYLGGHLAGELDGEVFEPLRDVDYFARFSVDDTLAWPNGADFAPEFLHQRIANSER
jgi:hypothetical protein